MKLTRRVTFSSGHRYWLSDLTEAENRALFGRWASPHSHGHNYALEVTVAGRIQASHGMVINIKEIDALLREHVVSVLDQKSLNDEVPAFRSVPPSTENVALFIRSALSDLPPEATFVSLRLYEMPGLFVDVGKSQTVKLTRGYEFSASHRLHAPALSEVENATLFGKCNNRAGHGHNYELEVTVSGTPDPRTGRVADIGEIDRIVRAEVVDRYDHKHLNSDLPEFEDLNPTSELLTKIIWERLVNNLPAKLDKVTVRETARNIFEYSGEDE
ncbi:MAG: 6-carboxytetrahydropterin synthase [Fimbriimonadales bacterium]